MAEKLSGSPNPDRTDDTTDAPFTVPEEGALAEPSNGRKNQKRNRRERGEKRNQLANPDDDDSDIDENPRPSGPNRAQQTKKPETQIGQTEEKKEEKREWRLQNASDVISTIRKRENERLEQHYGKGLKGKVSRLLNEKPIGRLVKAVGKIALGTIGASLVTGFYGTPALLLTPYLHMRAMRTAIEGVMEIGQVIYGEVSKERSVRLEMNAAHCELEQQIKRYQDLEKRQDQMSYDEYQKWAREIVANIARTEEKVIEQSNQLASLHKAQHAFRVKYGAYATIAVGALNGVSLGAQNFDGQAIPDGSRYHHTLWSIRKGAEFLYEGAAPSNVETMGHFNPFHLLGGDTGHVLGHGLPAEGYVGLFAAFSGLLYSAIKKPKQISEKNEKYQYGEPDFAPPSGNGSKKPEAPTPPAEPPSTPPAPEKKKEDSPPAPEPQLISPEKKLDTFDEFMEERAAKEDEIRDRLKQIDEELSNFRKEREELFKKQDKTDEDRQKIKDLNDRIAKLTKEQKDLRDEYHGALIKYQDLKDMKRGAERIKGHIQRIEKYDESPDRDKLLKTHRRILADYERDIERHRKDIRDFYERKGLLPDKLKPEKPSNTEHDQYLPDEIKTNEQEKAKWLNRLQSAITEKKIGPFSTGNKLGEWLVDTLRKLGYVVERKDDPDTGLTEITKIEKLENDDNPNQNGNGPDNPTAPGSPKPDDPPSPSGPSGQDSPKPPGN